eukprot:TRINITY_DN726_c0_g2_i1.p1 TRINITY_DN726_c0_g2~~TRINITY_DN726_c0_g2_i1.p1  ORF type:complete len:210 (+),score=44.55 TRINITY_DN726_c0_g2_i1:349-978(+)
MNEELGQTKTNDQPILMQYEQSMIYNKPIFESEMNPFQSTTILLKNFSENAKVQQKSENQDQPPKEFQTNKSSLQFNQIQSQVQQSSEQQNSRPADQSQQSYELEVRDDYEDDFESNSEDEDENEDTSGNHFERLAQNPSGYYNSQFDENMNLYDERITQDQRTDVLKQQINVYQECMLENINMAQSDISQLNKLCKNADIIKNFKMTQ